MRRQERADFTVVGGVMVVADGHLLRVKGMQRGGRKGDPREPITVTMELENGDQLRREATLLAWSTNRRCWVYFARDETTEVDVRN